MEPSTATPTNIDALKRTRRPLRAQIVKRINEIEHELSQEQPDQTVLRVKLEMLQKSYEKVDILDQELLSAVARDGSDEDQDAEMTTVLDYEERYRLAKVKVENFMEEKASETQSQTSSSDEASHHGVGIKRTYKLPKIEIRKFNGEIKEWLGFWSQFQKIHEDAQLHNSDKFQYLAQAMVPGTRAYHLVNSYPQSAENYPLVIAALQDRFGDKVMLTEVYVRQLLKLVIRNVGKGKPVALSTMYDELESHLRALETLGVTQEQSAAFLYPLVESSLPEEIVRAWQRSAMSGYDDESNNKPVDERLSSLMKFLRTEVKGAERLSYVSESFVDPVKDRVSRDKRDKDYAHQKGLSTAAGLFSGQKAGCIFCDKSHDSQMCGNAQSMPYGMKKRKILEKKACLCCLRVGHVAKTCKAFVKCIVCQKKHVTLMCPELDINKKDADTAKASSNSEVVTEVHSQLNCTNEVLLQTLRVVAHNGDKAKEVRVLLDPGSQKSYILEKTARQLGLESKGEMKVCHLLFGGHKEAQQHNLYELEIESNGCHNRSHAKVRLLGHEKICGKIPRMSKGQWMTELKQKKIFLNDLGEDGGEIELLIGSDYYPQWVTGRRHCLQNGLVALETSFGWTVSGKLNTASDESCSGVAMQVTSMFLAEASVSELWNLDTIGIHEPVEKKAVTEADTKQYFLQTVMRSEDGRYVVSLPWIEAGSDYIVDNREVVEKRLVSMTSKLLADGRFQEYGKVFDDWVAEDIIEVVDESQQKNNCYYLPHRAVFKPDSQTTPVRPVFDASCKSGRKPSLNELLEKGPNLIELIPAILLRFRRNEIGVTADIRKAFQMIEVREADREFLRFLWWEDSMQQSIRVYRHKRVVFGVNCSPFLLAAVLELHLKSVAADHAEIAEKLLKSFYVDNCVTSVNTYDEYDQFKGQAVHIISEAKMQLRNWECSLQSEVCDERNAASDTDHEQFVTKVLGLVWNKMEDSLSCEVPTEEYMQTVTKRSILSCITKIFDPIGLICPALLPMKLILQCAWVAKVSWDESLSDEVVAKFRKWHAEIKCLQDVQIARHMTGGICASDNQLQLHTFCDASQDAYAAVVYLRAADECGRVSVQLIMAKSRLAPLKRPTIPRMELLACVIGARLTHFVRESLNMPAMQSFLWSDSSTAISWIKRNDEWGTFVGNRVKEICSLTKPGDWRHIPGVDNPADLPSRGCSPAQLLESRWWEGPSWLHEQTEDWPAAELILDETAISVERKKSSTRCVQTTCVDFDSSTLSHKNHDEHVASVALLVNHVQGDIQLWYLVSSSYVRNIRVIAWLRRFIINSKPGSPKQSGSLSVQEFVDAETVIIRIVQQEVFQKCSEATRTLVVEKGSDELYHVKTKLTHNDDGGSFSFPVLLPSKHPLVTLLIRWYHVKYHHAGTQFLMSTLREKYWILQSRRAINRVIHKCPTCLRHSGRSFQVDPATLPLNRTEASYAFQTTGVDLAGPLFLKSGEKAWIILFTCAVYRCVHLDFVTSQSTEAFLNALERFVNVRGRPATIYSDNGTNFVGLVNLFKKLSWKTIEEAAHVKHIKWIFNPPSAAWWGGWWERLIRTVKDLLKRMLGNARLSYDQLRTSLSHAENIVNERPLTVVTEDQNDLIPLTPAMFLRGSKTATFPEGTALSKHFQKDYQKRQSLQHQLRVRFRREYLSQLVQRAKEKRSKQIKVGDVVLVGADDKKRLQWPLAKVVELIPGRDAVIRVARVKTQHGVLVRPLQRLYPLEVSSAENIETVSLFV